MLVNSNQKILFISANNLLSVNGGSVLFKTIIEKIPKEKIVWVAAGGLSKKVPDWLFGSKRMIITSFVFFKLVLWIARKYKFEPIFYYLYRIFSHRSAKKIIRFIKEENISKIWVHGSNHLFPIVNLIRLKTNLPIHLSIHDDYEAHLSEFESKYIKDDFEDLIKNYTTCDLISEEMRLYYIQKYNRCQDAKTIWVGDIKIFDKPKINNTIKAIGYAGNIWAVDSFKQLIAAVEKINRIRTNEDKVEIHFFSERLQSHLGINKKHIKNYGYLPFEHLIPELQKCDLLYVPMSFHPAKKIISQTSLPAKLITYICAQIPILAHGPEYSTVVNFVSKHNVGFTLLQNDPLYISEKIKYIEKSFNTRKDFSLKSSELLKKKFYSDEISQLINSIFSTVYIQT